MDQKITYEDLIEARRQEMEAADLADKTIRNAISYLRRYLMAPCKRPDDDLVGAELGADFESTLEWASQAAGSNHRAVRASLLQWKSAYDELYRTQGLPANFGEALKELFRRYGLVDGRGFLYSTVVQSTGVNRDTLQGWVLGKNGPASRSTKAVDALEDYFGLSKGTLLARIPNNYGIKTPIGKIPTGVKRDRSNYALKIEEITASLKAELGDLIRFKVAPSPPPGMERNQGWKVKPASEHGREIDPLAQLQNDRFCPSAAVTNLGIRHYLGYLHREHGVPVEELSLALIANADYVHGYLQFLSERAGEHTTNLTFSTSLLAALIHPKWGFVAQQPVFADRYLEPISQTEWRDLCGREYQKMVKLAKDLERGRSLVKGRDSEERIEAILRDDNPVAWLIELEKRLSADKPSEVLTPQKYACWVRDRLIIRLFTSNPLRKNQMQTLTWRRDNTGDLRQDRAGQWWLIFEARRFKNDRFTAKKKYQAPVDDWAAELIPHYLDEARPFLRGADECDYLLLPSTVGRPSERFPFAGLDGRILGITQHYLPDVAPDGFRPHALRHIIATGMLKDGYTVDEVASVLHDKPETIRRAYAHLVESDGAKALSGHLAKLRGNGLGHGRRVA